MPSLRRRQMSGGTAPQWASLDPVVEPLMSLGRSSSDPALRPQGQHQNHGIGGTEVSRHRSPTLLDAHTYKQAVWADLSADQTFIADIRSGSSIGRGGGSGGSAVPFLHSTPGIELQSIEMELGSSMMSLKGERSYTIQFKSQSHSALA